MKRTQWLVARTVAQVCNRSLAETYTTMDSVLLPVNTFAQQCCSTYLTSGLKYYDQVIVLGKGNKLI